MKVLKLNIDIYMNITIIMNMNIYITQENEQKLRQLNDWTMSGLVNYLLVKWFDDPDHNVEAIKENVEKEAFKEFPTKMQEPLPEHSKIGVNLCKIHSIPLTANGKCLQKGCKYS